MGQFVGAHALGEASHKEKIHSQFISADRNDDSDWFRQEPLVLGMPD